MSIRILSGIYIDGNTPNGVCHVRLSPIEQRVPYAFGRTVVRSALVGDWRVTREVGLQ
jgi:hypothetical protein